MNAVAEQAAACWGTLAEPLRLVVDRENAVYEARFSDGRHGALRLHRAGYQSAEAILSELRWTQGLAASGFRCPLPISNLEGALIGTCPDGRYASVISWIDAAPIGAMGQDYEGPDEQYRAVGALIGSLHKTTDTLALGEITRPSWERDALLGEAPHWGRFWENPSLSAVERDLLQNARAQANARLDALEEPDIGLIHADVLQENILQDKDGLWLIDFDDAGVGYRLYDLGTALIQHLGTKAFASLAEALADGYHATRGVRVSQADLMLFTMLRGLASCGWIMSRAADDDPRQALYAQRAVTLAKAFLD